MSKPLLFPRVLSKAMAIITLMYLLVAVVGYGTYGNLTESPILHNLPVGIFTNFANIVITIHVPMAAAVCTTDAANHDIT